MDEVGPGLENPENTKTKGIFERFKLKTKVIVAINQVRTNIENNRDSLINLIDTKSKSTVRPMTPMEQSEALRQERIDNNTGIDGAGNVLSAG